MVRFARLLPIRVLGKVANLESPDVVVVVGNEKLLSISCGRPHRECRFTLVGSLEAVGEVNRPHTFTRLLPTRAGVS